MPLKSAGRGQLFVGGAGADVLHDFSGGVTFVVAVAADMAGDLMQTGQEEATDDMLRLDDAGAYGTGGGSYGIDVVSLNENSAGFAVMLDGTLMGNSDANNDGAFGDLLVNALVAMTNGVSVDANSCLSGRLIVDGTSFGGNDTFRGDDGNADTLNGGAGDDRLQGQGGADGLTGAAGADDFAYSSAVDSNDTDGRDLIADFGSTDQIDLDGLGLATPAAIFDKANAAFVTNQADFFD